MWKVPGSTNSLPNPLINPRISLIVAMDTAGEILLSLSQANTNVEMFKLFLTFLSKELNKIRPSHRTNTVIQLDGATYHLSPEVQSHMKKLGLSVIYSGP